MRLTVLLFSIIILLAGCSKMSDYDSEKTEVRPGLEVFLDKFIPLVEGKRVGLITNPTGVDRNINSIIDLFAAHPEINLVALYGPEHGVRGNAQAGEYLPFYFDGKYDLPVFSLYGQSRRPEPEMLKNIDEYMRSFDSEDTEKIPDRSMITGIDIMVYDIQDVGTRIYTYIATMAYCMQVCGENDIGFIVLDRPNPINGINMEGPVLDYPEFSSFVGLYPIPVRHGMTSGELALLFNDRFLKKKTDLTVIPMEGWTRSMWYDQTELPWITPSPNMPTLETAVVYPGQVYLEGTNISEGRGTTRPFELFGAPWIDGYELVRNLNQMDLPGVQFREAWFTPVFSKYTGELCGGAQLHIINRELYKPFFTALSIIHAISNMYPSEFTYHPDYFDQIMGTEKIRLALEKGEDIVTVVESYEDELRDFREIRKAYLLY
ncbi:MAG: DUF1343 domain-containing protein [Candidatus Aminicenantes bacterium]|nr:DUF1343 domain-containing protein [Candidatus Aminicenantes bacterium]